jgi:hypothetical protein
MRNRQQSSKKKTRTEGTVRVQNQRQSPIPAKDLKTPPLRNGTRFRAKKWKCGAHWVLAVQSSDKIFPIVREYTVLFFVPVLEPRHGKF